MTDGGKDGLIWSWVSVTINSGKERRSGGLGPDSL